MTFFLIAAGVLLLLAALLLVPSVAALLVAKADATREVAKVTVRDIELSIEERQGLDSPSRPVGFL